MHRRTFIQTLAASPLLAQRNDHYAPTLQAGVYVWTQHYGRLNQKAEDHIPDICAGFKNAGFRDVELMSQFFTPAVEQITYSSLAKNGLTSSVIYNGGNMHTPEDARATIAATVELAQRVKSNLPLRAVTFNPNPKPKNEPKTGAELAVQSAALEQLGWTLEREGLFLLIHQHAPEMADNAREWRHTLANTDRRYVRFCLDTHWVLRGGQNVMQLLKEAGPRLGSLHLRNSVKGVWSEDFSDGDIDYSPVAAYLRSITFDGYLSVELAWDKETKLTRDLPTNLRLSREYAERTFGIRG